MTWRTSPAATELETLVIDWVEAMVALSDKFDGVVYDTASVGVMHALAVARGSRTLGAEKRGSCRRAQSFAFTLRTKRTVPRKKRPSRWPREENVQRVPTDTGISVWTWRPCAKWSRKIDMIISGARRHCDVGTTSTAVSIQFRDRKNLPRRQMWLT